MYELVTIHVDKDGRILQKTELYQKFATKLNLSNLTILKERNFIKSCTLVDDQAPS